ncbi:DUF1641 domain-containing protein [Salinigranum halophilum]|jgi:hypothetical protein|uniref:DUF1641 domain-containing protein n=1 Tax=Salinigranum halophilum TaxID=2565931 RepID=UPI0010A81EB7|nr:DUF1641 domain-containing protein [Salinigranum halophilum]
MNEHTSSMSNGHTSEEADLERLRSRVAANADDLLALLDLLVAVRGLSADLVPEARTAVAENREPLSDLRTSLEREETLVLLRRVGDNAEALSDLLDLLDVTRDLAAELGPELKTVAVENRSELEALRLAFEREETLTLLRRLGHNTDTFCDLLTLLEMTGDVVDDVTPTDDAELAALRADIERLEAAFEREPTVRAVESLGENMETLVGLGHLLEGFGDAADRTPQEYYELGERLGYALDVAEQASDPAVLDVVSAGADGLAADTDREVGLFGLVSALRDDDVRRSLGTALTVAERVGQTRSRTTEQ